MQETGTFGIGIREISCQKASDLISTKSFLRGRDRRCFFFFFLNYAITCFLKEGQKHFHSYAQKENLLYYGEGSHYFA